MGWRAGGGGGGGKGSSATKTHIRDVSTFAEILLTPLSPPERNDGR